MKRTLCLLLALLMITCVVFTSCSKEEKNNDPSDTKGNVSDTSADTKDTADAADIDMHELFNAVNEKLPFDGFVREVCYKDSDIDEMIYWTYGVIEASCYEKVTDYVITLPSDYNQSFAAIVFDDSITDEEMAEVKDVVTKEYIRARASSLQMYMPEEYDIVKWQLDNPDAIWRQYGNVLVLLMYGAEEAADGWAAVDEFFK